MKNLFLVFLFITVLSCSSQKSNNTEAISVESTLIAKGNLYGSGEEGISEENFVITDSAMWNDLMSQMNSVNPVSDDFTETSIDFSQYTIIAAFAEVKTSGGYSINIQLTSDSEQILVTVVDNAPSGNATAVMTQPFHIIKISNSELPIVFE